jgi:hypothetical protein
VAKETNESPLDPVREKFSRGEFENSGANRVARMRAPVRARQKKVRYM